MQMPSRRKHFLGASCCTDMAQKCTGNRTRTTAQTHKLWHLSVMLSVYATSLSHPLYLIRSPHAMSPSCTLRNCGSRCTTFSTEEWQVHIVTRPFLKTLMQIKQTTLSPCSLGCQLVHDLRNSQPDCYSYFHQSHVKLSKLVQRSMSHIESSQLPLDWWDYVSVSSRFGSLLLATNSCNSGRKPGLNLQREFIKCVLIHDQSLIQKVLGNLEKKDKTEASKQE